MSKEYTLADFTDIFDYSTGWFSDSSICSLFYQIFKRFPSMKMVKYKVNQDFLKEIKELYQQDDAFDIFEHVYCNHFENEKEEEEEEEDNTSTKELYDCIVICKKNLMISRSSSNVPHPPGRAITASERFAMSCLRSCIVSTSINSVKPL